MISIFASLFCSVAVGVLLKIAKKYNVIFMQTIGWNYAIAILLAWFLFRPNLEVINFTSSVLIFFSSLWILLPSVFLFQALSLYYVGIVKTDIAQRLSLFIPILASYFLFNERFTTYKVIGIIIAFVAIFFTLNKSDNHSNNAKKWYYPLMVLFGFGLIDVLFKKIVSISEIRFTTSLFVVFCGAFIVTWILNIGRISTKKDFFYVKNIYWGIALGLLNFGNIYFYLRAHKELSENPSTVFATMNLGVIILGSLVGVFFFNEKLNKKNYFGILLALLAVVLIVISQVYKG